MNHRFLSKVVLILVLLFTTNILNGQNITVPLIAEGSLEEIQNEISNNVDINAKINDLGWTALHAAVRFGRNDIVKLLVDTKANLNAQDNAGQTPLLLAVESGQLNTVTFLIENDAKVNIASNNGDNPLSMANKIGLNKISDFLLLNNAQPPEQNAQNQTQRGNRRGMMPGMNNMIPDNIMNRRGPGGNEIDPEQTAPAMPVNNIDNFAQNANEAVSGNLDQNEVQARIQKYPGLKEAILDIADGSKSELKQWRTIEKDNRVSLISAIRKQFQSEVQFIQKTATEEKAQKTIEQAKKLDDSRKSTFLAINREVRDNETSSRTTTSSRRSTRTNTTATRSNRRGTTSTVTQSTTTTSNENKYSPEVQNEIDTWLNSDVTEISNRINLLDSVNNTIVSEINSLKQTANGEKAEKTVAAIDGVLLARQIGFNELKKEFQGTQQDQLIPMNPDMTDMQNMPEYDEEGMMNQRGMNRGQSMPAGRGSRGR